jgi:hypothetical protein
VHIVRESGEADPLAFDFERVGRVLSGQLQGRYTVRDASIDSMRRVWLLLEPLTASELTERVASAASALVLLASDGGVLAAARLTAPARLILGTTPQECHLLTRDGFLARVART